mgnify:CR=1 FL=1
MTVYFGHSPIFLNLLDSYNLERIDLQFMNRFESSSYTPPSGMYHDCSF